MQTTKKQSVISMTVFIALLFIILTANYISYGAYRQRGFISVISVHSIIFLLFGTMMLGISCFTFLQLSAYKTGRLFAIYTLLLGFSISLAPCNQMGEPLISIFRAVCTITSSLLLFQVVGNLTLTTQNVLFRVCRVILTFAALGSIAIKIMALFPSDMLWIHVISASEFIDCTFWAALFSVLVMLFNYKRSNDYARKQMRILMSGIGSGVVLFLAVSVAPYIYLVRPQNSTENVASNVELLVEPAETTISAVPLLLLSGISIAIIFILLKREFVLKDTRIKLWQYLILPVYLLPPNMLLFIFSNCPVWLLICITLFLSLPVLFVVYEKAMSYPTDTEEQAYEWRLLEEVEKQKQELSSYLHDEVLQSMIAFYRKVQSDSSGRYDDIAKDLSKLISEIRGISHNLFPTMVEDLGVEQSLMIFVNEMQAHYPDVDISFQYEFQSGILPKQLALTVYRIVKELVTNAAKHACAEKIICSLKEDNNGYYIRVKDNGKGFSIPDNRELLNTPHMGLYTVRKRIHELQGQINFQSSPQTGTDYHIFFPKEVFDGNL